MLKERYIKPEIKSETLEAEAFWNPGGSQTCNNFWLQWAKNPSCGVCCEE